MLPALMHATQVASPFHTKGWVYEEKYDGWRMVALKDKGRVRLVSRNERDHTKRFPHLVEALTNLKPASFTLDGEVAVFDEELVSCFEWLRRAIGPRTGLRHLNHGDLATPPLYMVFDLLQLGEKDYRPEPLKARRKALEKLVKGQSLVLPARRLMPNGFAAWTEVLHRGWEGYVAKDPESSYTGGRTLKWLKVKVPEYRVNAGSTIPRRCRNHYEEDDAAMNDPGNWFALLGVFGLFAIAWALTEINDTLKGIREAQETLATSGDDL